MRDCCSYASISCVCWSAQDGSTNFCRARARSAFLQLFLIALHLATNLAALQDEDVAVTFRLLDAFGVNPSVYEFVLHSVLQFLSRGVAQILLVELNRTPLLRRACPDAMGVSMVELVIGFD